MSTTDDLKAQVAEKQAGEVERPSMRDLIEKQRPQMARALQGTGMNPDRLARIALTTCRQTPQLFSCTQESLLGALMLCAQLGLEPGGPLQQAYLIPRKNKGRLEVNFQVGYRGLIDLARRSGEIRSIEAREVCANDDFEYEYGLEEKLRHRPADGDRGQLVGAYCLARFRDGGHYFVFVSDETIRNQHEARAQKGQNPERSPWATDRAAMYRKTAVVVAAPYLPRSTMLATAIAQDGTVHDEVAEDLADMTTPDPPPIDVESRESPPAASADRGGDGPSGEADPAPVGSPEEPEPEPGDDLDEITDRDALKEMAEGAGCDVPARASVPTLRSLIREARLKAEPADDGGEG